MDQNVQVTRIRTERRLGVLVGRRREILLRPGNDEGGSNTELVYNVQTVVVVMVCEGWRWSQTGF